ncbi:protein-L-isoaspartate(D-aspartate) O-methyltransferase [Sphingomonadales bacterium 56]|uniref:protein-L-isoaspartate(D-aspartate) O-methyltransferase n=1 Tax=unclassified Sphingobium TaxID=2611147 RepID=UPI001A13FD8A|nr:MULTISPECIES: protein-L-isoaspartate(D-aspartate) O-methyltransferase [unclassified Sphingobium]MBY2928265.1 protein-L-isoaspartate(D-aspartate) O-methyltransferase [Sphingomonadales bacterium 56]MBY2958365.1 protein-L-isoaspartate(D-aspartate) O-methyltransferase [Sphingomonadales bacterium 58]CAD7336906.1 Protein-L-isoaspartate O-methyltransferase [Sphingobium sp. S6]CAD7336963.1 Protein-L-isoaspartate O-methyltransferase [Sphingobium sp. S8]
MADCARLRQMMVEQQIIRRGVGDPRLWAAMRAVPRERFVPEDVRSLAYEDRPLPVEAGQTISQPYIVARMIEAGAISPENRVLEVGAGSGYAAAVMSRIAAHVFAVERIAELAALAEGRMKALGYDNVSIGLGDGTAGWAEKAPFDAILVAAGGPGVPPPLREQLAIGGRLVMPVGDGGEQQLVRLIRKDEEEFDLTVLEAVRFVPLIGAHGWKDGNADP